jgi:hypothetical protein
MATPMNTEHKLSEIRQIARDPDGNLIGLMEEKS